MEIKDRKKALFITLGVIVGGLIVYSVVYEPLVNTWKARNDQIKQLQDVVRKDQYLVDNQAKIEAKWKRWKDNALPGNTSLAVGAILTHKESWTQTSGVTPGTFQPQIKTDDSSEPNVTITTMECRADAEGNMSSLLSFLQAIENDSLGVKLEDVELSSKDINGRDLTLGLTMSALILDMPQSTAQ